MASRPQKKECHEELTEGIIGKDGDAEEEQKDQAHKPGKGFFTAYRHYVLIIVYRPPGIHNYFQNTNNFIPERYIIAFNSVSSQVVLRTFVV